MPINRAQPLQVTHKEISMHGRWTQAHTQIRNSLARCSHRVSVTSVYVSESVAHLAGPVLRTVILRDRRRWCRRRWGRPHHRRRQVECSRREVPAWARGRRLRWKLQQNSLARAGQAGREGMRAASEGRKGTGAPKGNRHRWSFVSALLQ